MHGLALCSEKIQLNLNTLALLGLFVRIKFKWVALLEFIVILILLGFMMLSSKQKNEDAKMDAINWSNKNITGLLSPRVYAGLLEPKNLSNNDYTPLDKDAFWRCRMHASTRVFTSANKASRP